MPVWLVRGGKDGEYEDKFLNEGRVYVTWGGLDVDLKTLDERQDLEAVMQELYPDSKPKAIQNWASQVFPFAHEMVPGDLVVLPQKSQPTVSVGEIAGDYQFDPDGPDPFFHWRSVKWIGESIPRDNFGQDLRYSLGAFMTICRIKRNNAEERIRAMRAKDWSAETISDLTTIQGVEAGELSEASDLEELGRDQIAQLISARFKGHQFTRLVEAVLVAQGYTTFQSPEGPDGGVDILAGSGPLGFSSPRLCVEVKSESAAIDRPTVDKLLGAVSKFGADEGLFVAWGGFKKNVQKELASTFFRLRLWSRREFLAHLFEHYDRLDEDIRADLPLKRVWTVASQEE